MKIIIPKRFFGVPYRSSAKTPFFFLAGPIRGGGDWQATMCRELQKLVPECVIACPCRWDEEPNHSLTTYFTPPKEDARFPRQLNWERHYLHKAARKTEHGCIIFWLGVESTKKPHPGPEPYAMDTRGELAAWRIEKKYNPRTKLVVGGNPKFHGFSQIQRNFDADLGRFVIHDSIAKTAEAAVRHAYEFIL